MNPDRFAFAEEEVGLPAASQLRVLSGRAAGAATALERHRWLEIGYALSNDIVIRDPGARGVRLRLRLGEATAQLEILEGAIVLLGHVLNAPGEAILPPYVPLTLGAAALAFGEAGDARWRDAERLLRAGEAPADEGADAHPPALPPWRLISPAFAALSRRPGMLSAAGGALVAIVIASLGWTSAQEWLARTPTPQAATATLAHDGFPDVRVEPADGGLVARGVLSSSADWARLQEDVARRRWPITLDVTANDQLREGVADVLRANGYQADVRVVGPGFLAAYVRGGDPARLERVREEALRDNPDLKRLLVEGGGAEPTAAPANEPGEQVISVVGGDLGYVQTADGSRYFVGGVLPSGQTITSIDGRRVTVDLNGRTTILEF